MTDSQRSELTEATSASRIRSLIGGALVLALAAYLGQRGWAGDGGWYWVGTVLLGIFGLTTMGVNNMKSAPCPACGNNHWIITEGEYETCHKCKVYLQGDKQAIWLVEAGHVAPTRVFQLELQSEFYWPPCCCACGAEATRTVEVSFNSSQTGRNLALAAAGLAVGALVVRRGGGSSGSVDIPHCEEHADGAELKKDGELLVHSFDFFQQFQALNPSPEES